MFRIKKPNSKLVLLLFIFLIFFTKPGKLQAQFEEGNYSFADRNLMWFGCYGVASEFGNTGEISATRAIPNGGSLKYFTFFSIGFEGKVNVFVKPDVFSLAINVPVDGSIVIINDDYSPFRFRPGLFLSANIGNGSSFGNVSRFGLGVGLGFRYSYLAGGEYMGLEDRTYLTPTVKIDIVNTASFSENRVRGFTINIGIPSAGVDRDNQPLKSNYSFGIQTRFKI